MNIRQTTSNLNRPLFLTIVMIGMFCSNFNQTILAVAQPTLMHDFAISAATAQWLSTGYSLIIGIMTPVTAWLADNYSSKWLYETSMLFFILGTASCFFSHTFIQLLLGRLLQAVGGALLAGIGTTMLFSIYPPERRGTVSALMGIVFGLAPAVGPTYAGWIIDQFRWNDVFGSLLPLLILALVLGSFGLQDVVAKSRSRLDWPSVGLSTIGFGCLLFFCAMAGNWHWTDWRVIGGLLVGAIFTTAFFRRQQHIENPVLKLSIFNDHNYRIAVTITSITQVAFAGFEFVLPLYLQTVRGLPAIKSGAVLILGALTTAVMSPITGYVLNHFGGRHMIRLGLFIMIVGTLPFLFVDAKTPMIDLILLYAIRNFGFSAVNMPVTTLGMQNLTGSLIAHGSSGNNMLRFTASAIGTSILISVQQQVQLSALNHGVHVLTATLRGYHTAFALVLVLLIGGSLLAEHLHERRLTAWFGFSSSVSLDSSSQMPLIPSTSENGGHEAGSSLF